MHQTADAVDILPVDSKWAAMNLLERFVAAESISARQALRDKIESVVLQQAKEDRSDHRSAEGVRLCSNGAGR